MRHACSLIVLMALLFTASSAQEPATASLSKDLAGEADGLAKKWNSLLEAMPDSVLDWRPAPGVRSVRELFTHIGDANYYFMTFVGAPMPEVKGMPKDQTERENRMKTKSEIAKHLAASFSAAKKEFDRLQDGDLSKEINMFGSRTTARRGMLVNIGHMHEHLGQAIAYARVNGVKPPWSGD